MVTCSAFCEENVLDTHSKKKYELFSKPLISLIKFDGLWLERKTKCIISISWIHC